MDALAADFCPPKKTIVETIAAAPSRLARFCFSFSLSSEDDSDEDATIEKHVSFALFLFDDDDDALLLMMKILLPVGFCSRLEDDDRIIHFFEESLKEEEEEPTKADTKAALLLIEDIIEFAFFARSDGIHERDTNNNSQTTLRSLFVQPFGFSFLQFGVVLLNPNSNKTLNKKFSSSKKELKSVYSYTYHRHKEQREK